MTYDRKTIEENGVDLVKKRLRTLNVLDPNIPTNDKGVSWEGMFWYIKLFHSQKTN